MGKVYKQLVLELDVQVIPAALREHSYNKFQTAKSLGINRNTLEVKLRRIAKYLELEQHGQEQENTAC